MLEISQFIVQEIAQMDTRHSWARELMLLSPDAADEAEEKMEYWIEAVVKERYPESDGAERMVRCVWLHLLEWEAIEAFVMRHPVYRGAIPIIPNVVAAVLYAKRDVMYADREDERIAMEILEEMKSGKLKPDLQKILGR